MSLGAVESGVMDYETLMLRNLIEDIRKSHNGSGKTRPLTALPQPLQSIYIV